VAVPGNTPLQAVYSWQPAGAGELDTLLRKDRSPFDVVHVEHLRGVRYALRALRTAPQNVPIVWDSVDCISLLFRQASRESNSLAGRLMTRLELGRTETYEGLVSSQFARVLVTSAKDRAALARLRANIDTGYRGMVPADDSRLEVLPNGVDLSYFQPIPFEDRVDNSLIVSGKMSYHANVSMVLHLVNEIMPRIWAQRPEVRLVIVGKDPVREIVTLAEHPKITVMGFVPDIRPFIQKAAIAVAPLVYGVGIQNKVLESLACGVPTITTSQAADALAAERHRHLLVADDPDTFAAETLHLLASPVRRFDLGQAGRAYVEEHHDWNVIARRLAGIYRAALSSKLVSQGVNIHPRGDKSKS
jgi:glycosyltransferase involved in cell wall biosynthesis